MQYLTTGPILIFIAAILWGLDGVLRRSLFGLPPITIVFFEHLIGLIIISPFLYKAWKQETLSRIEWGTIGVVALFSGVLGTLFFTTALLKVNFIQFSVVFLLQKLQPLFAVFTAWLLLKEKITIQYALWAALALGAAYFVTFPTGVVNVAEGGAHVVAALFALGAAILWGSSTAFSRFALLNHSHTFITGLRFLLTVPIALMFVFALGAAPSLSAITVPQLGILVLIACSSGMGALWIYYRGLKYTKASIATIVELAFPVTAIAIDYFLYGTILTTTQYLAAAVLFFAMYRVSLLNRE
ncbi:DMT family transporter [Candidatus Parcubacteria bacterium]|nr:MAG: DMT family transporter [Candidatus Parcubacteria bacterium]